MDAWLPPCLSSDEWQWAFAEVLAHDVSMIASSDHDDRSRQRSQPAESATLKFRRADQPLRVEKEDAAHVAARAAAPIFVWHDS